MNEPSQRVGWGKPLGVVLALHLGLFAVPLSFDSSAEVEPEPITLTLKAPEPVAEPVEPEPLPEPPPEPEVVPEPPPEPVKPPPRQQVEAPKVASSEVVVPEPEPEIVPPPEEAPVSLEAPVEVDPEATEDPVEETPVADEPAPEPTPAEPPAPLVDPVDWGAYESRITGALEAEKRYPRMARRMGVEGEAVVRMIIRRDGTLAQPPQLVRSSGNNLLDKEVLRMVEAAEPYAGLPEDSVIDEFELVVPVNFLLE